MKVLVTGGAGFIGSHVVDSLLAAGHEVVVVDDLSTGKRSSVSPEASFYKADIIGGDIAGIVRDEEVECVVHHAAQASVRRSIEDTMRDARVNVLGTLRLLEGCVDVDKFIYASTGGAIYGNPEALPAGEEDEANPISPYGLSKYAAEKYLEVYSSLHGLKHVSLRYANVYGPRQDPNGEAGVVAIFAGRLLAGKELLINGDGEQTRDFVYIEDVAKANPLALEKEACGVFNIGSGRETSVNELAKIMLRTSGARVGLRHVEPAPAEVRRICLDCSKAEKELGWKAEVSLEEGIRRTLEYLRGVRGGNSQANNTTQLAAGRRNKS